MRKNTLLLLSALAIGAVALSACGFFGPIEEASSPVEAEALEIATETPEISDPLPTADDAGDETAAEEPVEEPVEEEPASQAPAGDGLTIYEIDSASSQVRFELDEDLSGVRTTVVGVTSQVAGQLAVDAGDAGLTQVGTITINARDLTTDNNFRNRALRGEILDTNDYEFITFEPTAISGLSGSVAVGETVNFDLTGNLTIRDITTEVTFAMAATLVSETQISGSGETIVTREAYGLVIPSVPRVANVEEDVELYIDFIANAVN